jgi:hypothetical protein
VDVLIKGLVDVRGFFCGTYKATVDKLCNTSAEKDLDVSRGNHPPPIGIPGHYETFVDICSWRSAIASVWKE